LLGLLWCPVDDAHMISDHVQAGALFSVVFISAGLLPTRHDDLLLSALLNDVREVFRVPTKHCDRIPGRARVFPLLRLLIEPPVRLSSTKRKTRLTILRELKSPYFADICSETNTCHYSVTS